LVLFAPARRNLLNALETSSPMRVYFRQGGAHPSEPPASEVRLPQGLRFTDVRRSTLGDFALARRRPRPPKSHGCNWLRPPSQFLLPLRLSSAASIFRANLRPLLDRISAPERARLRPVR
jgi:hypothetical protein